MIKTNEVRRGNLVQYNAERFKGKTVPPGLQGFFIVDEIRARSLSTTHIKSGLPFGTFAADAEGVPLTAEILEALGFNWNDPEWQPADGSGFLLTKNFCYTNGEGLAIGNQLKFLHQLQNLYFALTGDELNIPYKTF
jgi:hypothetical protein